jgi:hypothetical protein
VGRVVIARSDQSPIEGFPRFVGVRAEGAVRSRRVIGGPDRPLFLWMHELPAGAEVCWERPPVGHVAYVWTGEVEADGTTLGADGAVIVEHKGGVVLRAGPQGATLAHFHRREDHPKQPTRAGGNVHVVDNNGIFQDSNETLYRKATLFADAACPTCELYLQRSDISTTPSDVAAQFTARHFHTVDEIILVKEGAMLLGRRALESGAAIAIDATTIYTFGVRQEKFVSLNFRANDSYIVRVGPKNEPLHEPLREFDLMHDKKRQRFPVPASTS